MCSGDGELGGGGEGMDLIREVWNFYFDNEMLKGKN
jgi:hypothetical protein